MQKEKVDMPQILNDLRKEHNVDFFAVRMGMSWMIYKKPMEQKEHRQQNKREVGGAKLFGSLKA